MKRTLFPLGIGAMALFLLGSVLESQTGASSTTGAPMTMWMDCHGMPKGARVRVGNLPQSYQPGAWNFME
jgi:hypothetical protein